MSSPFSSFLKTGRTIQNIGKDLPLFFLQNSGNSFNLIKEHLDFF